MPSDRLAAGPGVPAAPATAAEALVARVIVDEPIGPLDYRVPAELAAVVRKGIPVLVPLRKRRTRAYAVEVGRRVPPAGIVLREIHGVDPERPPLPEPLVDLLLFAASYYGVREGEMLQAALPALARPLARRYRLTSEGRRVLEGGDLGREPQALLELAATLARGFTPAAVAERLGMSRRQAGALVARAVARGWLAAGRPTRGRRQLVAFERVGVESPPALARRTALLTLLDRIPAGHRIALSELARGDPGVYRKLRELEIAGLVRRHTEAPPPAERGTAVAVAATPPAPTPAQAAAVSALRGAIAAGTFAPFLLHGVTGSGKTEVYLRAIAYCLEHGESALVLVPEIALTPQLGDIFRGRFGERVATFHSGLTAAERRDEWERVARGEAQIGLGARSALFLPLSPLGLVIVDEEHETSFKQEESPRYHARDLAVARAQREGAVVVLGSATPSLESHANARAGRYRALSLPERVQARPLPEVERVGLATAPRAGDGMLSERLARALERTLSCGEQAILYLNRRGFAPYVYCRDCGHAYRCVDCDVALTLHRRRDVLLCHYCGFEEPAPEECVSCHGSRLVTSGVGLEKLEAELRELFGPLELARLDRDTVRTRAHLLRELERFRSGSAKILLGTQMVTKGHDFPGVTLVGVVLADASLNFPDFRAAERTFQILTQVAGRAGRGTRPGLVLVQGYAIDHYAVAAAARHDYEGFAAQELETRRVLAYPPYAHLALVRCEGALQPAAVAAAQTVAEELRARASRAGAGLFVLGPAPAPLGRLRGAWRMQVLVKSPSRALLRRVLSPRLPACAAGVRQILDVDPYSML